METHIIGSNEMIGSAVTRRLMVRKFLLVCGIISALIWLGTDIVASLTYEGYRYPSQPISGLTAIGAPTRSYVIPLDNIYNLLKIIFAFGVWISAGRKRALRILACLLFIWGIIDLTAYFFPWNPGEALGTFSNIMHGIFAGGATVLLFLLTIGFGASADGKWFRLYSYGTLLVFLVSGAAMAFLGVPRLDTNLVPPWFGVTERIFGYGYMVWMMVLVIILLRAKPEQVGN